MQDQHTATRDQFEQGEYEVTRSMLALLISAATGLEINAPLQGHVPAVCAALRDIADRLEETEGREGPLRVH